MHAMPVLILGLLIFLGVHSLRLFAPGVRDRMISRLGSMPWKAIIALFSLLGFVLLVWGFGQARQNPLMLYSPPTWLRHLNSLFTLFALILVAAAYVPRNHLKAKLGHPMLIGTKFWAFGHLLAIGYLRDTVLFGAFLAWAIAMYAVSRRRDRADHVSYPSGTVTGDIGTLVIGIGLWALFAFWLHMALIGVNPLS
jgi:uncharacterized membrane protein